MRALMMPILLLAISAILLTPVTPAASAQVPIDADVQELTTSEWVELLEDVFQQVAEVSFDREEGLAAGDLVIADHHLLHPREGSLPPDLERRIDAAVQTVTSRWQLERIAELNDTSVCPEGVRAEERWFRCQLEGDTPVIGLSFPRVRGDGEIMALNMTVTVKFPFGDRAAGGTFIWIVDKASDGSWKAYNHSEWLARDPEARGSTGR